MICENGWRLSDTLRFMSSKWNVNYKTWLICKASQLKTRKRKCVHESIETEEAYVCCKCGLAVSMEFAEVFVNVDGAHLGHDCCVFVTSKILLQIHWPTRELVSFTSVRLNEKHGPMILRLRFRKQITTFDEGLATIDIQIQRVEVTHSICPWRPRSWFSTALRRLPSSPNQDKKTTRSLICSFEQTNLECKGRAWYHGCRSPTKEEIVHNRSPSLLSSKQQSHWTTKVFPFLKNPWLGWDDEKYPCLDKPIRRK